MTSVTSSTSTSGTSGTATPSGLTSSGGTIDVASIVSQLMAVEQQPLTTLQTALTGLQSQVSTFGSVQSQLSALQTAAQGLSDLTAWQSTTATSADQTKVTATTSGGASPGTYGVTVSQLAQSQSAISGQFGSSTAVVGGGTLTIQMGTSGTGSFTADSTRPASTITIKPGATLADVRTAINSANAGVTASLVNDGTSTRLMIRSSSTGASNAFLIGVGNAEDGSATGLGGLTYDPSATGGTMTTAQPAQDAKYSLDGLALTSASNTVANAMDGVTLQLNQVSTAPVNVTIATDTTTIRAAVDKFVSAYNTLNSNLESLTSYNATTQTAGALQGNFMVVQMQSKLRSLLSATVGGSSLSTLSNAGIAVQRDGSLLVNDTKFNAAAANPKALQALFSTTTATGSDGTSTTSTGIASQFNSQLTQLLGTNGTIAGALASLQSRETDNQTQQDALNTRLTAIQKRLTAQYTALDTQVTQMNSLSTSLTQQLAQIAANRNSSS